MTNPPEPASDPPEPLREEPLRPLEGRPAPLHPAAILLWTLEVALPLMVALLLTGAQPVLAGAALTIVVGVNLLRYLRFRWWLEPDALVVERGLLHRRRRVIRRDRIQTVDLERGIRHRMLGVVELRVEALGGGATEGRLSALDPEEAEELRGILLAPRRAQAPGEEEPDASSETLARVSPSGLVLAGLTGGRVGVLAAGAGFLLQFLPEERVIQLLEPWVATLPDPTPAVVALLLLGLVGAALILGFLLSVLATVVVHWDFTLTREGRTLWVRRGLLTQHRDSVPLHRIQAVRVEENLIRRALGLAAVRAVVAGRAGASRDGGSDLILPVGSRAQAVELAARVVGAPPGPAGRPLTAMPEGARTRRLIRAALAAPVAGSMAALAWIAWGPSPTPGWPWVMGIGGIVVGGVGAALALAGYRGLGWADLDSHLAVREGVLNRRTSLVPVNRLQEVTTRASPFQQRRELATLHLGIARPPGRGFTPRGVDMAAGVAGALRDRLPTRITRPGAGPPVDSPDLEGR